MISFPNAKINIGLAITSKREDGYHDIASCFYPIGWTDILEIVPSEELSFSSTGIDIPGDANGNLCLKAYHLLKSDFDISPVTIHLHKVIPIGAGLGGGSADGAYALKMLNEIFELNLSTEKLEEYALELGSDCPFFITNNPLWVTGRGEVFSKIELSLAGKWIMMVNPNIHISTKEAYSGVVPMELEADLKQIVEDDISIWKEKVNNDFEQGIFKNHPQIKEIKEHLYKEGAVYASMTGSGSTLFGIFETKPVETLFSAFTTWVGKLDS
ncbi:4-(cytidine 5'-diphospho)-2-C-methyl-D-erythritol kinase [Flammeovirga sp. EKP202]|uniref:4-(cytidine 5'-diphospho)-2-C-methyl-D-erythritol kinase n=1 Tax=Flammeovirga sp. EKP202 TaxID=2770592 RepID=UPI00165F110B|nr:4-(cytidine 5'-diphospho)-2-C-methyl-D-erythritol kinase [Flammeovirga sp. EKP202]MBD0400451.1 4-(cytidine 5'-diphospho)-2-C-methyl-D-erythritol kinase [Flammeovirga sp. EKP202]